MKRIVPFLLMAIIGFTTNCSDDNNVQTTVDETEDEINFRDSLSALSVATQMYEGQEGEKPPHKFVYGRCINPSEPNKYYIASNSADEAALFYNTHCTNESLVVTYSNAGDSLVSDIKATDRKSDFGSYGYTSLSIGDGNPVYATIEVSLKEVGDTHQLIFVPESYFPDNSDYAAFQSPYLLGDIYKDLSGDQWLCVRQSQPGEDGYFVRLTDGDEKYWERRAVWDYYKHPAIYYAVAKTGYTIAEKSAWEAFCSMISYGQGRNALTAMKNKTNDVSMDATRDLMRTLAGEISANRVFQVGQATITGRKYHAACARRLHKVWIRFIRIKDTSYLIRESYSWHELDTQGGNLGATSLKQGQEMLQLSFRNEKLSRMTKLFPIQGERN
ncbi:hypothetical protein EII33_01160 [Bacteroides heparinolyticus]|uniref:Uncharacterized protein n=1 Tax=Prevotella heparinolytica TaxID=28113 RepID=A0A3P2ADT2_9BACE|nr:hypothetical protein [Bacteroides heparinolyticus]RRD93238.1 hypothetical protein EII33_01160 [Bacteroides heparinolyticus]VFB13750.1 Uncharacterised protein [Bacteroides heparinolyticus]